MCIAFGACSPKQDQQTVTVQDSLAPLPTSTTEERVDLTPELIESLNQQLFLSIHGLYMSNEPIVLATIEEFKTDGTKFEYTLIRDNMRMSGWHDPEEFIEQPEATPQNSEDSDSDESEEDDGGQPYSQGLYAEASREIYNNQVDTIYIKGDYEAYVYDANNIRLKTTGKTTIQNLAVEEDNGEITIIQQIYNTGDYIVFNRTPEFTREKLYLKAKIVELTNNDLKGLTKDDLTFFRNEIFARHGHTFKTPKMLNYFNNQKWYQSNVDDAGPLLNKFEKLNVEFIKSKEK